MAKRLSEPVKSIGLSLTVDYAPSWKTWEGIRELVQNWHDGVLASVEESQLFSRTLTSKSNLAFVSCQENGLLVYKAVVSGGPYSFPSDKVSKEVINHSVSTKGLLDKYLELGRIVYSPVTKQLTLINCNTELARKVLLLGFSKKASNREVIGQFGEGLKVGALALVREGRLVSMETSKDRWDFGLSHDDIFQEDVLTVFVSGRNNKYEEVIATAALGETDTCVTVFSLDVEDWELCKKRFLFLHPPSNFVKTELGTLLIDDNYKGQLFVKGVWVSDLSKDGLATGVDFIHLKIDRDRRAVVHHSDIDHQVSSMWVHAIQQRPDLIDYYYSLLKQNDTCDVRHAQFYLNDRTAVLVAEKFFAIHGAMTYPVTNNVSTELLMEIKQEVHQKLVLCNEVLIGILCKSGMIEPLDVILSRSRASAKRPVIIPYADLSKDEVATLRHVEKLVQLCCPEFNMAAMDISESEAKEIILKDGGHFEISRTFLTTKKDHYFGQCCVGKVADVKCLCAEAYIATKIVSRHGALVRGSSPDANDNVVKLVASLAAQLCAMSPPFCEDLHAKQQTTVETSDRAVFREREEMLQREKDLLNAKLLQKDQFHAQDLLRLKSKISLLEKDLDNQQVYLTNAQQDISENWEKTVKKLQSEVSELKAIVTSLEKDKISLKEKLVCTQKELKQKQDVHSRHLQSLRKLLADKFEKLSQTLLASKKTDLDVKEILKTVSKEMEDLTSQDSSFCIICIYEKANCVIIPCHHQVTCFKCASLLEKCAYCRGPIRDMIYTYGL